MVVYVTGAGDSFCGGFMAGYLFTHDPLQAAAYGAVSASFIVESLGARKPNHYQKELAEQRLTTILMKIPSPENIV